MGRHNLHPSLTCLLARFPDMILFAGIWQYCSHGTENTPLGCDRPHAVGGSSGRFRVQHVIHPRYHGGKE